MRVSLRLRLPWPLSEHKPLYFVAVLGYIMQEQRLLLTFESEGAVGVGDDGANLSGSRNSPQCLHFLAATRISSAQNGHSFRRLVSVSIMPSTVTEMFDLPHNVSVDRGANGRSTTCKNVFEHSGPTHGYPKLCRVNQSRTR